MANNATGYHDGGDVLTVVHPRSDFPEMGWVSFAARAAVPTTFTAQQPEWDHSFRTLDRRPYQSNCRRFYYADVVQQWWTSFKVPIQNQYIKQDWHQDTTRTPSPRDEYRLWRNILYPDAGEQWWTSFVGPISDYIEKNDWHIDTTRTLGRRDYAKENRVLIYPEYINTEWNVPSNIQPAVNPAINDWHIDTVQTFNIRTPRGKFTREYAPDAQQQWWTSFKVPIQNQYIKQDWHQDTFILRQWATQHKIDIYYYNPELGWISVFYPNGPPVTTSFTVYIPTFRPRRR